MTEAKPGRLTAPQTLAEWNERGRDYLPGHLGIEVVSVEPDAVVMRMAVTEPEPGRVLAETDLESGLVTRFVVEPAGADRAKVTIATTWRPKPGLLGELERRVTSAVMSRIYVRELAKLDAVLARDRAA